MFTPQDDEPLPPVRSPCMSSLYVRPFSVYATSEEGKAFRLGKGLFHPDCIAFDAVTVLRGEHLALLVLLL